ncbi:MAG: hypothetical protein Q9164_003526 [Protoblastenia rupestris]
MVAITAIRASNSRISSTFPPSPTALFVGATSGIGQSTVEAFAATTQSPIIYLVGRSKTAGESIVNELKSRVNPAGEYEFISADCTLISEVDRVCEYVKGKVNGKLDFICLTCGYLSFGGRDETKEGLDALLSVRYYARMRFIQRLLPLQPKHILSVGAATREDTLVEDDLSLKDPKNYGILSCVAHATTMMSLSLEHLAKEYPNTAFVHSYPGIVKTQGLVRGFPWWGQLLMKWVVIPLMTPFSTSVKDCGQLCLFYLTSKRYPSLNEKSNANGNGVDLVEGVKVAEGDGAYLVDATGEIGAGKPVKGYRERGMSEKIWEHTEQILEEAGKMSP